MTEGISKGTLLAINPWQYDNQQDLLNAILELCKELDPWLPIENAPKNKPLWLFNGVKCLGRWNYQLNAWHVVCAISSDISTYDRELDFTHYKLLPEDPK